MKIDLDSSFLPSIPIFRSGTVTKTLKALAGSVLEETNQNLSHKKRTWLQWHFKLGHLGFSHLQVLGLGGFLGESGKQLKQEQHEDFPKCASCQYGKQTCKPDGTTHQFKDKTKEGGLKCGQLTPGDHIFMDQLESRVPGRLLHTAGKEQAHNQFCGSTLFCDAASGYIHLEHQVSLSASDTINSKHAFERMAQDQGVIVSNYHTDNGVFKSHDFLDELAQNYQSIRFSGVGAKWQNGAAEGAIWIVVTKA